MTHRKPPTFVLTAVRNRCPVCGEISYSAAGVHPQCSMRQADEKRAAALKLAKEAAKLEKPAAATKIESRWRKTCPKCQAMQHVRKAVCFCGYAFPT